MKLLQPLIQEVCIFVDMLSKPHKKHEDYAAELDQQIRELEQKKINASPHERVKIGREVLRLTKIRSRYT